MAGCFTWNILAAPSIPNLNVSRETSEKWSLLGSSGGSRVLCGGRLFLYKDFVARSVPRTALGNQPQESKPLGAPALIGPLTGGFRDDEYSPDAKKSYGALRRDGGRAKGTGGDEIEFSL